MSNVPGSHLKIRTLNPPAGLSAALENKWKDLGYRNIESLTLFHLVWLGGGPAGYLEYCGVYGDGANGVYEWFIFRNGRLETSNTQWGSDQWALQAVLNRIEPPEVYGALEACAAFFEEMYQKCSAPGGNAQAAMNANTMATRCNLALAKARGEA